VELALDAYPGELESSPWGSFNPCFRGTCS